MLEYLGVNRLSCRDVLSIRFFTHIRIEVHFKDILSLIVKVNMLCLKIKGCDWIN